MADYAMFSEEGNSAVDREFQKTLPRFQSGELSLEESVKIICDGVSVGEEHAEVYDTMVRDWIADSLRKGHPPVESDVGPLGLPVNYWDERKRA